MKLIRHRKPGKGSAFKVNHHSDDYCSPLNLHLFAKAHEELQEVYDANFVDPEEYADLLQVIYDMIRVNNIDFAVVNKLMIEKEKKYGNFTKGHLKL